MNWVKTRMIVVSKTGVLAEILVAILMVIAHIYGRTTFDAGGECTYAICVLLWRT